MSGLRESALEILQLIASTQAQADYARNVPTANVTAEIVCAWFDDFYHPGSALHAEAFDVEEQSRLAEFNAFFEGRHERLPADLPGLHRSREWREIQDEARTLVRWLADRPTS